MAGTTAGDVGRLIQRAWLAADSGLAESMNAAGAGFGCQPLAWTISGLYGLSGFPGADYADDVAIEVATRWAAALGLAEVPDLAGATRCWSGRHGHYTVEVWCIVDRAAFDAVTAAARALTAARAAAKASA